MSQKQNGFGLVELLIGVAFFALALMPLVSLFSTNLEGINVVQARCQATIFANEVISQASSCDYEKLAPGIYDLSYSQQDTIPDFARHWKLCDIPDSFSRTLVIDEKTTGGKTEKLVQVVINNQKFSQACLVWYRSLIGKEIAE